MDGTLNFAEIVNDKSANLGHYTVEFVNDFNTVLSYDNYLNIDLTNSRLLQNCSKWCHKSLRSDHSLIFTDFEKSTLFKLILQTIKRNKFILIQSHRVIIYTIVYFEKRSNWMGIQSRVRIRFAFQHPLTQAEIIKASRVNRVPTDELSSLFNGLRIRWLALIIIDRGDNIE